MAEQQQYHSGTMVLDAEHIFFPSYIVDYRGKPHDRRVAGIRTVLSGLHTIASASHASAHILQAGVLPTKSAREIAHDDAQVQKMSNLMAAIWHFGKIANASPKAETETEKIEWKRSMQYVADLPEEHFVGKRQRRGLHLAKGFAARASQQPQHRNTCLSALDKHIHTLQSTVLSPYHADKLGIALPPFEEEPKRVSLSTPEAINVRRKLFPFVDHDVVNSLGGLKLRQFVRASSLRKLAKLTEIPDDPATHLIDVENLEHQLKEDEHGILVGWLSLFDSSVRLARLMEHPYRQTEAKASYWQKEIERTVIGMEDRYSDMEIYFKAGEAYGNVVWAEEWMESLLENIGQNVGRIWLDTKAKRLPQTLLEHAHPILGITAESEGEDFVLSCEDNGTGFEREYLERGFQGQHGYISHNHSTGTAMKELATMIAIYGGRMILKNVYITPNGEKIESSDAGFSERFGLFPSGGIVEVRFPLL